MSVQSEIDRINENVANTYNVLEGAGADMPQTRNTANLSETAASIKAVLYGKAQSLTEAQKTQARENIGVVGTGKDGQRGTGLLPVTTAPSSYTTQVNGLTPSYRIALSTVKSQASVNEVFSGDTVRYSYYHYPVIYVDSSYVYCRARVNIRGATGAAGEQGEKGDPGVYILAEGETIADAPASANVVIDPSGKAEVIPEGGIDVEGAVPGQTIVVKAVDANGRPTEWEAVDFPEGGGASSWNELTDKPFYSEFEEVTVLSECTLTVEDGGTYFFDPVSVETGKEYTINWNGVAYKCAAIGVDLDGMLLNCFGDVSFLVTGEPVSGEPFVIICYPPEIASGGEIAVLDGSDSVTISITCVQEIVTQIPSKYVPSPDWNAEEGKPGHVLNRTHYKDEKLVLLPDTTVTIVDGMGPLSAPLDFVVGEEYEISVNINGSGFVAKGIAAPYNEEGVELGTLCKFADDDLVYMFIVASFTPEAAEMMGCPAVISMSGVNGEFTCSIYRPEKLKQLDPEFIPKRPLPFFDLSEVGAVQVPKNIGGDESIVGNFQNTDELLQALEDGPVRVKIDYVRPEGTVDSVYPVLCGSRISALEDNEPYSDIYRANAIMSFLWTTSLYVLILTVNKIDVTIIVKRIF